MYLQSTQVELSNLYLGVPTRATVTLLNGTLLPTEFHWGQVRAPGPQPSTRGPAGGGAVPRGASHPSHCLARVPQSPESWAPRRSGTAGLVFPGPADSPAEKEAVHTAGLPPSVGCDWSTQLLGAQLGHCPWGSWEPGLRAVGEDSTFLRTRGSCLLPPLVLGLPGRLV